MEGYIEEFNFDPNFDFSYFHKKYIEELLDYLDRRLGNCVLDIGRQSPSTEAIREKFRIPVTNTEGDLDVQFGFPSLPYTDILYLRTLNHQFNPLYTLLKIKDEAMSDFTKLYILVPSRGKLLWDKGCYHEVDHYRMCQLLKRAGLKIREYERVKVHRHWSFYFKGVRPLLKLFFEYNAFYVVTK